MINFYSLMNDAPKASKIDDLNNDQMTSLHDIMNISNESRNRCRNRNIYLPCRS